MSLFKHRRRTWFCLLGMAAIVYLGTARIATAGPQKKAVAQPKSEKTPKPAEPANELATLKDDYVKTSKEYKASLQRLLVLYEASRQKAEARLKQSQELYKDGMISRQQMDESEQAWATEQGKVIGVKNQMATADMQIAQTLLELEGEKQIAKLGPGRKGSLVKTTSFIRFNGGSWAISNAGKIQRFFSEKFSRPLPIAVFGQGAIHERWRLDHRNAMDISLHPDGVEGQALMSFLKDNGIPFMAFRGAIPGVATGPHIHIGLPSHRY